MSPSPDQSFRYGGLKARTLLTCLAIAAVSALLSVVLLFAPPDNRQRRIRFFGGLTPIPDMNVMSMDGCTVPCFTLIAVLAAWPLTTAFFRYRVVLTSTGIQVPSKLYRSTGPEIRYGQIAALTTTPNPEFPNVRRVKVLYRGAVTGDERFVEVWESLFHESGAYDRFVAQLRQQCPGKSGP